MTTKTPIYSALSDEDLLKRLIGVRQTRKVYRGKLAPLFAPSDGQATSDRCLVARELVKRWLSEDLHRESAFGQPSTVKYFLQTHFGNQEYESFVVLHLDAQHRLIYAEDLFRGTLTQTSVYPREVVKSALRHNAAAVMFAHNHPSGVAEPSQADELLTRSLRSALALVDVQVLDHFVVTLGRTMSFAERGLL